MPAEAQVGALNAGSGGGRRRGGEEVLPPSPAAAAAAAAAVRPPSAMADRNVAAPPCRGGRRSRQQDPHRAIGSPHHSLPEMRESKSYIKFWAQHCWPDDNVALVSLACGGLSGVASSAVTFPSDLERHGMQLEGAAGRARFYNKGLFAAFGHISRNEGFHGLDMGILPEYCKVVPSVGEVFLSYETLKAFLSDMAASDNGQLTEEIECLLGEQMKSCLEYPRITW